MTILFLAFKKNRLPWPKKTLIISPPPPMAMTTMSRKETYYVFLMHLSLDPENQDRFNAIIDSPCVVINEGVQDAQQSGSLLSSHNVSAFMWATALCSLNPPWKTDLNYSIQRMLICNHTTYAWIAASTYWRKIFISFMLCNKQGSVTIPSIIVKQIFSFFQPRLDINQSLQAQCIDRWSSVFSDVAPGTTALHLAAAKGRTDLVELLTAQQGIDTTKPDVYGQTPIMAAQKNGHTACVALLSPN